MFLFLNLKGTAARWTRESVATAAVPICLLIPSSIPSNVRNTHTTRCFALLCSALVEQWLLLLYAQVVLILEEEEEEEEEKEEEEHHR